MKKLLFLTGLLITGLADAQITFQKTFSGGYMTSVQQTLDSGYIVAGYTGIFGAGLYDVFLIRFDADGDSVWAKTYGGNNLDWGGSVQQTLDSGFIFSGKTNSFGAGMSDVYLIKTDANGDTMWTKTYGGSEEDVGYSVQQTTDGGYIVAGVTESFGVGNWGDIYLIKTDGNGDTLWTRTYGDGGEEWGYSMQQTSDSGYIITGYTNSYGAGDKDVYLIKTDTYGDTLWTRTYGGSSEDRGFFVQQTFDNGYIIAGNTMSFGAGSSDVLLIKTDTNGDTLWSRTYGGGGDELSFCVQQTSDTGYIVSGFTESFGTGISDIYLIKTDSNGDTLWTRIYDADTMDWGFSVKQTIDSGYIISGVTGNGFPNLYLIKTDANGNSLCNYSSTGTIVGSTSSLISSGAIINSGAIVNNTATIVTTAPTIDSLICDTCNYPFAGFNYTDSLLTVNFSDSSTGATSWYWDFGDGNNDTVQNPTHTYATAGTYWVCLIATNECGSDTICDSIAVTDVGIIEHSTFSIVIYPNPTEGKFRVKSLKFGVEKVEVYDLFGRKVLESKEPQIDMSSYPAGLYIWRVGTQRGKVVIE